MNEFAYGGEVTQRPQQAPALAELTAYVYGRRNVAGLQREWWFHRLGCELWFQAERDTRTNEVVAAELVSGARQAPVAPEATAAPDAPAV